LAFVRSNGDGDDDDRGAMMMVMMMMVCGETHGVAGPGCGLLVDDFQYRRRIWDRLQKLGEAAGLHDLSGLGRRHGRMCARSRRD
jgi:hypothetical protein